MTYKFQVLLQSLIIPICSFVTILTPTHSLGQTTLQVIKGGGDFQSLETAISVTSPQALTFQWTTEQAGVTGGTWRVTTFNGLTSQTVASGESPAANGKSGWFKIPADAFLQASPPDKPMKYRVRIVPHNAAMQPLGSGSPAVVVTQLKSTSVTFGSSALYPSIEILRFEEKIGTVPLTQIHFAGADVTLRVKNKTQTKTDPIMVSVQDGNVIMRQITPQVSISSLSPGAQQVVQVHLSAILPPPKSQMPQEVQYAEWKQQYADRCVALRAVMEWKGPKANAPMNDRSEVLLTHVSPCEVAKNIHVQLDKRVSGYAFFVGPYANFDSYGLARTTADGAARNFTPSTKITVASVSKLVTAIAAVRILAKNGVRLDDPIGKFFPSDWNITDAGNKYVFNLTFADLLGQRSGIKDYGNVAQDYLTLKNFFKQNVSNFTTTLCNPLNPTGGFLNVPLGQGFTPSTKSDWCYSNYNFSIFRILLPRVAGFPEDINPLTRPLTLARQYVTLVQQNVFDLVGQPGVDCKPPIVGPAAQNYAFSYFFPGSKTGLDWGDNSLTSGAAGWYLSVEDISRVLFSLDTKDGKILSADVGNDQWADMRKRGLGWDPPTDIMLQKNGGGTAGCDVTGVNCKTVSTVVAIFGSESGPRTIAVLFLNSNIFGGPSHAKGADFVLQSAYNAALNK